MRNKIKMKSCINRQQLQLQMQQQQQQSTVMMALWRKHLLPRSNAYWPYYSVSLLQELTVMMWHFLLVTVMKLPYIDDNNFITLHCLPSPSLLRISFLLPLFIIRWLKMWSNFSEAMQQRLVSQCQQLCMDATTSLPFIYQHLTLN